MSTASSRSSSTTHTMDYTPQQFLTYLQSMKKFANFDQSTLILQQSQPSNKASSLNIRITEHQHIGLHDFITDCILISQMHSNPQYKSSINNQTETSIISIQHITNLLSKSSSSFLLSFYNQFFHFLSILTQMFDEKIVSTKLRIRGPYLLMMNKECMKTLCCFLLSQITLIQHSMHIRSDGRYEMQLKQMKNLRYILHLIKNLLQFELFTFDFLQFEIVSNMILFCQNESKEWSKSIAKLFDAVLMIQLPTHSVNIVSKFTVDKLVLLETKAILTTKAFRSFIVTFIRFLIIHYHQTIVENNTVSLPFNHLDVIMNELFQWRHNSHNCKDIMSELWSMDKLQTEFKTEYETKQKYQSSAFLKGSAMIADDDLSTDNMNFSIDAMSAMSDEWSTTQSTPSMSGKKRKRSEFEDISVDISNQSVSNKKKCKLFITEQCRIIILDKILPFCMDFAGFYRVIAAHKYAVYHDIITVLNDILLYFIKNEKWWYLSHIMALYNALFEDQNIFKYYLQCLQSEDKNHLASNIKYGIYSFIIWISYLHQITPKPVICFFDDNFDANKALQDVDGNLKREKLMKKDESQMAGFECLKSVQLRITELSLSKAVLIKLLMNIGEEWLIEDIMTNFIHIRDRYVVVKLLMILLHDIEHLELHQVLDANDANLQQFISIFRQFKSKMLSTPTQIQAIQNEDKESLSNIAQNALLNSKSKIVFRKQTLSIKMKYKRTQKDKTETQSVKHSDDIKRDANNKVIFEHFTTDSMKIVDCIVNDTKHLLYQFVTSPSKSKAGATNKRKRKQRTSPITAPPPVFESAKERNTSVNLSLLSSTLSSIECALDVTPNEQKKKKRNAKEEDDFDFDFDFQRISNINRTKKKKAAPVKAAPQAQAMMYEEIEPPPKKRKVEAQQFHNDALADLLSFVCATPDDKNNNNKNKKDNISPRYPRPKAPTMRELDSDVNDDSNWTNVVNLNRY